MRPQLLILGFLLCAGCAITSDTAVTVATRELKQHGLPLPAGYSVTATRVTPDAPALHPANAFWEITFVAPQTKIALYEVEVDECTRHCHFTQFER